MDEKAERLDDMMRVRGVKNVRVHVQALGPATPEDGGERCKKFERTIGARRTEQMVRPNAADRQCLQSSTFEGPSEMKRLVDRHHTSTTSTTTFQNHI